MQQQMHQPQKPHERMTTLLALFEDAKAASAVVQVSALTGEDHQAVCTAGTRTDQDAGDLASCMPCSDHHARLSCASTPVGSARYASARGVCILTAEEAIEIFLARKERSGRRDMLATRLANQFGVAPRTVRDIWNLRTWVETTRPLWSSADVARETNTRRCSTPKAREVYAPPEVMEVHAHTEWKLCAAWLTPGEELKMDEFDLVLDRILASVAPPDVVL